MSYKVHEKILDDIMILMGEKDMVPYRGKENELEHKIRKLINCITKSEYFSPLDVSYENGMYTLRLGLNCRDASPISLSCQGDEDDFIRFLEKEFRKRKLQNISYTTGTLINGNSIMFHPIIEL